MYKFKGELKTIKQTEQISDSFKKREFVAVDNSSQYPQTVLFQSVQDRCDLLDNFKSGDMVEISFNLRGREWTNPEGVVKVFNTLDAWKIVSLDATDTNEGNTTEEENGDDLPF